MAKRIRVLIVDDHTLFRESLTRLLQADTDFQVAHTCATVAEALRTIETTEIDVVLLDYDLNGELGLSFLHQSKLANFSGRVLMVTSGMGDAEVLRAIESGVAGIFLKNSPLTELIQAIVRITKGEPWIDPGVAKTILKAAQQYSGSLAEEKTMTERISERERQVIRGILEGLSNKEISQRLGISEGTVKASLQQLFARTGVRTRSQLVRIAVEKHSADWLD